MVSPAKVDPAYRPTAISTIPGHDLRSGRATSPLKPPAYLNRQKLAPHQNGGHPTDSFWTAEGAPTIGMFPTMSLGSISQMTQLHPIPLNFSRPTGSSTDTSARSTNIYHAGTALGQDHSPLGRDIPLPVSSTAHRPTRRMTRSSILLQPLQSLDKPIQTVAEKALTPVHQAGQLVDAQDSVAQRMPITEVEDQDQERKPKKTRLIRERHQAVVVERKECKQGGMRVSGQSSPSVPCVAAPNSPDIIPRSKPSGRTPASTQVAANQNPKHLGRAIDSPQGADHGPTYLERTKANPYATAEHSSKYLQRAAVNPQATIDSTPKHAEKITVNPHAAAGRTPKNRQRISSNPQTPKYPRQVAANPPVTITQSTQKNPNFNDRSPGNPTKSYLAIVNQPSGSEVRSKIEPGRGPKNLEGAHSIPVQKSTNPTSWMTPEKLNSLPRPVLSFPIPQSPSDPSFGTTRPGTESPDYFNADPSWAFMQSRKPPLPEKSLTIYGSTPEPETLPSPTESEDIVMEKAISKGKTTSGSTPTSYSQCPGSPTSLINMYRVHGDLSLDKRKGLSLLHTKRPYIGENVLLDLDMPEWGDDDIMEIGEMEQLMDEMMDGKPGAEVKLASTDRDRVTGGQCSDSMSYVEWR